MTVMYNDAGHCVGVCNVGNVKDNLIWYYISASKIRNTHTQPHSHSYIM